MTEDYTKKNHHRLLTHALIEAPFLIGDFPVSCFSPLIKSGLGKLPVHTLSEWKRLNPMAYLDHKPGTGTHLLLAGTDALEGHRLYQSNELRSLRDPKTVKLRSAEYLLPKISHANTATDQYLNQIIDYSNKYRSELVDTSTKRVSTTGVKFPSQPKNISEKTLADRLDKYHLNLLRTNQHYSEKIMAPILNGLVKLTGSEKVSATNSQTQSPKIGSSFMSSDYDLPKLKFHKDA